MSYGELADMVSAVAAELPVATGTQPVIAIHGASSPGFMAALMATMKVGAVALPIDDRLPLQRKEQMLAASSAALVVDSSSTETSLFPGLPYFRLDPRDGGVLEKRGITSTLGAQTAESAEPAYVFLTSGTTGKPKAVLGRTSSLDHFVAWQRLHFSVGPADRFAQITNLSFDPCLREIFVALTAGATLLIPDGADRLESNRTFRFVREQEATVLHMVPTLGRFWTRLQRGRTDGLDRVRLTVFAGEPLSADLVAAWRAMAPSSTIANFYGPTETTMARFFWQLPAGLERSIKDPLPVGHPIPDTRAVILGGDGTPAAGDADGEIFIDTAFGTHGYISNADEQAKRFVSLPGVVPRYGKNFYRTGDLGRLDEAGRLVVLGRVDNQIKVAGVRVDPLEVAEALRGHPAIKEAVVGLAPGAANPDAQDTRRLTAWYIPADSSADQPDTAVLRTFLGERLIRAMIPALFVPVEAFPTTPNGKLDSAALQRLCSTAGEDAQPALTPTEQLVSSTWSAVMQAGRFHAGDDFFSSGGNSLQALEVALELERITGVPLQMQDVLDVPTIRDFARLIDSKRAHDEHASRSPAPHPIGLHGASERALYPLSPQQLAYQAVCMPDHDANWCNLYRMFALPSRISESDLRRALGRLIRRHDVLRLRFPKLFEDQTQEFLPAEACSVDLVPISTHELSRDPHEADSELLAIRAAGSQKLFDIAEWPIFKLALVHRGDASIVLLWVHHLTMDGMSLNLLAEELAAELGGQPIGMATEMACYRDYIVWRPQYDSSLVDADRLYWRQLLDGVEPLVLPEDTGQPGAGRGHLLVEALPEHFVASVRRAAIRQRCTPFGILLGAFALALSESTGRKEVLINIPVQTRPHSAFQRTLGVFFSQAIVRLDGTALATRGDAMPSVSRQLAEGQRHTAFELHARLRDLGISGASTHFPITTALFNQNAASSDAPDSASVKPGHYDLGRDLRFQVQGEMQVIGDTFLMRYLYRSGVFPTTDSIRAFSERVRLAAERIAAQH